MLPRPTSTRRPDAGGTKHPLHRRARHVDALKLGQLLRKVLVVESVIARPPQLDYAASGPLVDTIHRRPARISMHHSFNAQLAAGAVIFTAGLIGGPVSTTQVVGSTIVGVGAGHRTTDVRWLVVKDIMIAWLITIPITALLAAVIYWTSSTLLGQGLGSLETLFRLVKD